MSETAEAVAPPPARSVARAWLLGLGLLAGCAPPPAPQAWLGPLVAVDNPATPGSRYPRLARAADGTVVMSWLAPAPAGHELRYAYWEGGAFGAPTVVAGGPDWFVNWADFPSVVPGPDGRLAAHWLRRLPGHAYAYEVRLAVSGDRGAHWSAALSPHDDGTATEHGFVSLLPDGDGLLAAWLDGRHTAGGHDHEHAGSGAMTLRAQRFTHDGRPAGPGVELDARVCDCCQTGAALAADGPVVVYRDRDGDEVRDIALLRLTRDGWQPPVRVHADRWRMPACPVNGPAVDAQGSRVAVAWFTAPDQPRVRLAFSSDGGASFAAPFEVASGTPLGRVDVVLLADGRAVVTWLEGGPQGARVLVQPWTARGAAAAPRVVTAPSAARSTGFPQLTLAGDRLLFAWTDGGDPAAVHTAAASLR